MDQSCRIHIFLIEDDQTDADRIQSVLQSPRFNLALTRFGTLDAALLAFASTRCDLLLLDRAAPRLDPALRHLGSVHPGLPVIVLSTRDDEDAAMAAVSAGAQDYLVKDGLDGHGLVRAIRYAIARKQLEDRLRRSERRLCSIITMAQDAIISVDRDHRIVLVNPAAERIFGYTATEMLGQPLDLLLPERLRTTVSSSLDAYAARGLATPLLDSRREMLGQTRDGREFPVEVSLSPDIRPDGFPVTAIIRDITERRRFEDELRQLATTDALTGLFNRRAFLDNAQQVVGRCRRHHRPSCVLMFDIDHFKLVNDTYGHAEGDRVLALVADTCRRLLRNGDLIGRLGGEEFAILLPKSGMDAAMAAAERLRLAVAALAIPILRDQTLSLTASFGVAPIRGQEAGIEQALSQADTALYRAKAGGRNRIMAADADHSPFPAATTPTAA